MSADRTIEIAMRREGMLAHAIAETKWAFSSGLVAPIAIAAYVVLAPVMGSLPGFGLFDGQRVLQLLVLGIATVPLLFHEARAHWLQTFGALPSAARIGLTVVLGMGCTSALLAPLPRYAFLEVALFTLLFVTTITLASQFRRDANRTTTWLLTALVLGVALYLVSFAIGYVFCLVYGLPVWPKAFNGFVHVRFFNQYQAWTLPLVVLPEVLLPVKRRGVRYGLRAFAMMWYALLVASGGRGLALATAATLILVAILFRKHAWQWLRLHLTAMIGGLALYGVLFVVLADNVSVFDRLQYITQDSGRFELWSLAMGMIVQHPLLGEGPMHFARYLTDAAAHPHNAVLQWAAEWGLPSAAVMIGLAGWGTVAWVARCRRLVERRKSSDASLLLVAITAVVFTAGAYSLVSGVVVMPLSQLLLVVVVGWALSIHTVGKLTQEGAPRWGVIVLWTVIATAWAGVGHGVYPDVLALEDRQQEYIDRVEATRLSPRMWQQGRIGP